MEIIRQEGSIQDGEFIASTKQMEPRTRFGLILGNLSPIV
jgi:hypothetical protein